MPLLTKLTIARLLPGHVAARHGHDPGCGIRRPDVGALSQRAAHRLGRRPGRPRRRRSARRRSRAPSARQIAPSSTRCGSDSSSIRSLTLIGSPSVPLTTTIGRALRARGRPRAWSPAGTPPPPRPRSPDARELGSSGEGWPVPRAAGGTPRELAVDRHDGSGSPSARRRRRAGGGAGSCVIPACAWARAATTAFRRVAPSPCRAVRRAARRTAQARTPPPRRARRSAARALLRPADHHPGHDGGQHRGDAADVDREHPASGGHRSRCRTRAAPPPARPRRRASAPRATSPYPSRARIRLVIVTASSRSNATAPSPSHSGR